MRSFFDQNDDGVGDFPGLTSKLDYIERLGVSAIWLLPFYPSPMRDDGYDIADYLGINPAYGTQRDFAAFVRAAHERGLKVITELVVNHTSDQHPWFQAARQAPRDSAERDLYVWSDTDKRFADTRIIFTDTEQSNWTWDPVAEQYYWHRFFSHQPDLNHNNPAVVNAVIQRHAALARSRRRRLAARRDSLPLRARRHEQREPAGDACRREAFPRAPSTRSIATACCSPKRISGQRTSASTSATATSATWRITFR